MKRRTVLTATTILLANARTSWAQNAFPSAPIKLIVPLGAGGTFDILARSLGNELSKLLNTPVVVENKPGGQSGIGLRAIASSKPDGYTLGIVSMGMLAQLPILFPELPYKLEEFEPIAPLARFCSVLAVPASSPINSLEAFVAQAKTSKSAMVGISSVGSTSHLVVEQLGSAAGFQVEPVSYRSEPEAVNALLGGHVPAVSVSVANVTEFARSGKLRILAYSGESRSPAIATVPTYIEAGYPSVYGDSWVGVFAPVGLPAATIQLLHKAIVTASGEASFKQRLQVDMELFTATPRQLSEITLRDRARWGKLIADRNLKSRVNKT